MRQPGWHLTRQPACLHGKCYASTGRDSGYGNTCGCCEGDAVRASLSGAIKLCRVHHVPFFEHAFSFMLGYLAYQCGNTQYTKPSGWYIENDTHFKRSALPPWSSPGTCHWPPRLNAAAQKERRKVSTMKIVTACSGSIADCRRGCCRGQWYPYGMH